MTNTTVGPRTNKAYERSGITSRRALQVVAGTAALTLGTWAFSAWFNTAPNTTDASIASLVPVNTPSAHPEPAPQVWLSSLVGVTAGPFAAQDYTPGAVLPRVTRALPPLPPRRATPDPVVAVAPPVIDVPADVPPDVPPVVTAVIPVPDTEVDAQAAVDALVLAALRAPRRSLFPAARPAVAGSQIANAQDGSDYTTTLIALERSRTPQRRPEAVTRLAALALDAAPAPIISQTRREPLSVPPLNAAIARSDRCESNLTRAIPRRSRRSGDGAAVIGQLASVSGSARDGTVIQEVLSGNIPDFLRTLVPVTFTGDGPNGQQTRVTICVMPDYLAVGSDRDYVRVPLGLPAATRVAERFNMVLPTTRMVDAIYAQASVRLSPSPMEPGSQMASTGYFLRHNATVEGQRARSGGRLGQLVSGHKKDLVLTNRLDRNPGRVAIYGWHRRSGSPIQPLSTVHGAQYADYSHGIRLISRRAYVNGQAVDLRDLLADSRLAGLVSAEGTIRNRQLLASLR